jgi:hypothetical protein
VIQEVIAGVKWIGTHLSYSFYHGTHHVPYFNLVATSGGITRVKKIIDMSEIVKKALSNGVISTKIVKKLSASPQINHDD